MHDLQPLGDHQRLLASLPADAFRPDPTRLFALAMHLGVMATGVAIVAACDLVWLWLLAALVAGQSYAALGFIAHDLSHGSVVRRRGLRYALELLAWSPLLVPTTVWRITHHRGHHAGPNTPCDPDRRMPDAAMGPVDRAYFGAFYPGAGRWRANPLLGLHFIAYITRLTLAQLLWNGRRMPAMPCALRSGRRERARIAAEIALMLALQFGVLQWLHGSVLKLFFATQLPLAVGSAVATIYLVTNHFLRPQQHRNDPLAASTSVIVPRWMDLLHSHFSFHVEHHLFPSARSRCYPALSATLQSEHGPHYHRIGLLQAWRQLTAGPRDAATAPEPVREPGPTQPRTVRP